MNYLPIFAAPQCVAVPALFSQQKRCEVVAQWQAAIGSRLLNAK